MSRTALGLLQREAEHHWPGEACGFLAGEPIGSTALIREVWPAENRATRLDRYLIPATDVIAALRRARERDLVLLGAYHSHPEGEAAPSEADRREAWGEWLYLIVPCCEGQAGEARCWRWQERGPIALRVTIDD